MDFQAIPLLVQGLPGSNYQVLRRYGSRGAFLIATLFRWRDEEQPVEIIMVRRILITLLISLTFSGYASSEDKNANQQAKKIAEKVKRKAERSEKAEGRQ